MDGSSTRMLTQFQPRARQDGVVLIVALIVLVVMTLAGIALVRSVDTTNLIAGNMAFQQAATQSGDTGVEAAVTWLQNNAGPTLNLDHPSAGYKASKSYIGTDDPAAGKSWDYFWNNSLPVTPYTVATANSGNQDAAGNTVSYIIQRLCNTTGAPTSATCAIVVTASAANGNSQDSGAVALQYSNQYYYRITAQVKGPHHSLSYVQAIIAM